MRCWPHPATARLLFNFVTTHSALKPLLSSQGSFHQLFWPFLQRQLPFALRPSLSAERLLAVFSISWRDWIPHCPTPPPPTPLPRKSLDKPLLISRSVPCHCCGPVHNLFLDVFCPTLSAVQKHRAACSDICYHLMPSKLLISIKKWEKKISSGLIKQLQSLCLKANCTVSFT